MGGSAPPTRTFLLVHVPPPWPADVKDVAALGPLGEVGRVQLVWDGHKQPSTSSTVEVECYAAADPTVLALGHAARRLPWAELAQAGPELAAAARAADPGLSPPRLLVCSHGSRDRCCGSLGTRLAHGPLPGSRVLRTSHLGGHRFAPTVLSLPDGRYWAYADEALVAAVVQRSEVSPEVLSRYRGNALMPSPALQLAEAVAFGEVGWSLAGWSAETHEEPGAVRLVARDGRGRGVEVTASTPEPTAVEVPPCVPGAAPTEHLDRRLAEVSVRRWSAADASS